MKRPEHGPKVLMPSLGMGILLLLLGCSSVSTHTLSVDAISAGPAKFSGVSYKLVPRDPVLTREVLQYSLATTCVNSALGGKGMYPVSGNIAPDLLIEVDYGEAPMLVLPGSARLHELYLQLSARKYLGDAPARNFKGEEIWNVRISVKDPDPSLEHVLPILAAVATDFAGADHQPDNSVEVSDAAPTIVSVRNAVIGVHGPKPGS